MENKIYVIVAGSVRTGSKGVIEQPPGRQAAQGGHAVGQLRFKHGVIIGQANPDFEPEIICEPITTIWLKCRNDDELGHLMLLMNRANIEYEYFYDTNEFAYGPGPVLTSIAVGPISASTVYGILNYLPLWDGK
jgi:hypothetical protein